MHYLSMHYSYDNGPYSLLVCTAYFIFCSAHAQLLPYGAGVCFKICL